MNADPAPGPGSDRGRCPHPTTDHDAELDALAKQLVTAGLLELFTDDGDEAMRLTLEGEKVARQLAMSDDGDQDALLTGLLGDRDKGPPLT